MNIFRHVPGMIISLFFCCIALNGCAQFTIDDANRFRKGMSPDVVADIASKGPMESFVITAPSKPSDIIDVQIYELHFGGVKGDFYAIFSNKKLLYWGYAHEFARLNDSFLNEVGKIAVETYDNL